MANNKIILEISVTDKGTLKVVASEADKAAKNVNKVAAATKNYSKAQSGLHVKQNTTNKLEKGTAGLTSNSTKAFSKQAQTLGGTLVPAYATLAANIFALTAAFGALQRAAAFEQLQQGLVLVGSTAGQNLPYVAQQLREITGAAVSAQSAMSAVALGTASGFNTQQLEDLTKVAKGASLALGRNMEDALSRLVRGTAKVEPEILDELGIMVRLDAAVQAYATTIGKSATQLTQFERSQAFLNATIQEGLEKFSFVAESVDPNPYDQLASSFNNLTKTGFSLINTVLEPIVTFLSMHPTALMGAMILFASTIISKIVPGLNEMVKKQKELAAFRHQEAVAAAASVNKTYTMALAGVNNAFATVPKSVESMKEALLSGKATAQQYKVAITNLTKSEELRDVALSRYSGATLIAKRQELAEVMNLRMEVERLAEAEVKRHIISQEGALAGGRSKIATNQAKLLEQIDRAHPLKGLITAVKGVGVQFAATGVAGATAATRIRLGFTAATASVKLMGRALLNLIPFVGQAVFVFSMLHSLWKALFKESELNKQVKEITDSFKSFDNIAQQLAVTIANPLNSAATNNIAILRAEIGILEQVKSALLKVQAIRRQENLQKRIELAKEFYAASKKVAELNVEGGDTNQMYFYQKKAIEARKALEEASANLTNIDAASSAVIISEALANLAATGDIGAEAFTATKASLIGLLNEVGEAQAKGIAITESQLKERIDKILFDAGQSSLKSLDNIKSAIQQFNKEVNTLSNKQLTPFDNLINGFESFSNEFTAIAKGTHGEMQKFLEDNQEMANLINTYWINTNTSGGASGFLESLLVPEETKVKLFLDDLNAARQTLLDSVGLAAQYAASLKLVNTVSKDNPVAMAKSLDLQVAILEQKRRQLEAENGIRNQVGVVIRNEEKIKALNQEIAIIKAQSLAKQEIARVNQAKRILGLETRIVGQAQEYRKIQEDLATLADKTNAAIGNITVSPITEYNTFLDFEESRLRTIKEQAKTRHDTINLEFRLLKAQLGLERANAKIAVGKGLLNESDLAVYDTYADLLEWAQESALLTASSQERYNKAALESLRIEKARAAANEAFKLSQEAIINETERLTLMGWERLASQSRLTESSETVRQLQEDLIQLQMFSPEWIAKQLELEKAITEEKRNQLAIGDENAARAARLGGETFGTGAAFGANIDRAADVFNSDTALSEKLSKYTELSQGMIDNLRALGPEGEVIASVTQGALAISEAFAIAFEDMKDGQLSFQSGLLATASVINALGNVQKAQSDAAVASIDREIEAEKNRDGKSSQSLGKLKALEQKKEAIKRKAFEQDKKMKMAQVVMSTAQAIMSAVSGPPGLPWTAAFGAMAAALGAAQLAVIAGTSYQGGATGAGGSVPSAVSVGERNNAVDLAFSSSPSGELAYFRNERGLGNTGANNYVPTPAFAGIKHRASGGSVGIMTGEQGPEMFIPDRPGTVVPADDVEKIGKTSNVTFQINALDSSGVEEVLRKQRGNIIGMIREAANDHGEFFLEQVRIREDDANR